VGRAAFLIPRSSFLIRNQELLVKSKNLIILAAIVLVVAAYVFLFERHQPTSEEARQDAERVLHGFDRDAVTALAVEHGGERLALVKSDDDWRLVEPIEFPADAATVSSTLGTLANLKAERRLPAAEADPADYGLDPPQATLEIGMEDGSEISLEVGGELPLGSNRALRVRGADEIVIAPGWFVSDLERDLDDWRSRDVVDVRADQVASIDIEAGADTIRAVRVGDQWRLLSPLEDLADRDHIQGLISDLGALRIEEFLDDSVQPEELGLAPPEYRVTIVRSDGGEPIRLDLGATRDGEGGAEVACRRGDGEYFWVADRVRTRLAKAPVLWRSKKVWPIDTWNVERLRLSTSAETVELEKEDFQWRLAGGGAEVEQNKVTDRLTALAALEATDYDLAMPLTAEMGRAEVEMAAGEDGAERPRVDFTFYEPLSEGGRAMVRVSGRDTLMGVDPAQVEAIIGNLGELQPASEADPGESSQ
jgi:hypothetical protein